MAKRFSKEELLTGPPNGKRSFCVVVAVRSMGDENFLIHEEIQAEGFEVDQVYGLCLFDLDMLGEPIFRAAFKEWTYIKEKTPSEKGEK